MDDTGKKCSGMEDRIILYVDGELSAPERLEVESHLKSCDACRKLHESYAKLDRAASAVFVSDRRVPPVGLEKPVASRISELIGNFFLSPRFAFQAAALAAFILAAIVFYRGHIATEPSSVAVFGRFTCREFHIGSEPAAMASYYGVGEIAEGATIRAVENGTFSSEKFNVTFKPGALAKLESGKISLAGGSIDIDYFKKPAPANFEISTPNARIFIRGTKLKVSYFDSVTAVSVAEGRVAVMKKGGELVLGAGDGATVKKDGEAEISPKKETRAEPPVSVIPKAPAADRPVTAYEEPTAEAAVIKIDETTQPVAIEKKGNEKVLDYEVDIDSMDDRVKKLFFRKKQR